MKYFSNNRFLENYRQAYALYTAETNVSKITVSSVPQKLKTSCRMIFYLGLLVVPLTVRAQAIAWSNPSNITGDSDVLTTGVLMYAYDYANTNETVNGVVFGAAHTANAGGNVTTSLEAFDTASFTSSSYPFAALSAAYQAVLVGSASVYGPNASTWTVTLNNLVSGHPYLVQFWVNDPRGVVGTRTEILSSTGGNSVLLHFNTGQAEGYPGQYAVGYFTASGTSETLTLVGATGSIAQMNALQVRDLTGISLPVMLASYTAAQNVYEDNSALFSVSLAVGSSPAYQWQCVARGVTNNLYDGATGTGSTISGAMTSTLTISNVSVADTDYQYTCLITNSVPSATNSPAAPLTLLVSTNMLVTQAGDPIIDFTTAIGTAANDGAGLGPANIIDGTLAPYLNYGLYGIGNEFVGPVGFVVTPNFGGSLLTAARIYTSTNEPADDPVDFTLYGSTDGVNWSFIVSKSLALPLARNVSGGVINSNNQVLQEIDFLSNTNGYYSYAVYFTNAAGGVDATNGLEFAEVQLLGVHALGPDILAEPVSHRIYVGGSATFEVGLTALAGPFGYQWYQESSPLGGQTNAVLTFTNVQLTNAGNYTVVVSNSGGSVTSSVATLTVLVAQPNSYQAQVLTDGARAYWQLQETNGPTFFDSVSGYDGTSFVGNTTNDGSALGLGAPGVLFGDTTDKSINFINANNASIAVPYVAALDTTNFTAECWMNVPAFPTGVETYYLFPLTFIDNVGVQGGWLFLLEGDLFGDSGEVDAWLGKSSGWTPLDSATPEADNWVYVALTYDGNNFRYYQNGVQVASQSAVPYRQVEGGGPVLMGAYQMGLDPQFYYQGGLEQVAWYPSVLPPDRILTHYLVGTQGPLIPLTIGAEPVGGTNYVGYSRTLAVTASGSPPISYQWFKDGSPLTDATNADLTLNNLQLSDAASYYVVISNAVGSTNSSTVSVGVVPLPAAPYQAAVISQLPLAYWPLNETGATENAADLVGFGLNDGTYEGGYTLGAPGASAYLGSAVALDGSSGGVAVNNLSAIQVSGTVTLEAWIQPQSTNADQVIVEHGRGNPLGNNTWTTLGISAAGQYIFTFTEELVYEYAIPQTNTVGVATPIPNGDLGQWVHLVGTAGSSEWTLYRNGLKIASTNADTSDAGTGSDGWGLGATRDYNPTPNVIENFFSGSIQDVAIYGTVLSPTTVLGHYQLGTTGAVSPVTLTIQRSGSGVMVVFPGLLQQATSVEGPWTTVTGAASPYTVGATNATQFFRAVLQP